MSDTGDGAGRDDVTATDPPPAIRVLVVDDHRVVTETLAAMIDLQDDLECVGVAGTVSEMLDLVTERGPDVVITDVWLPGSTASRDMVDAIRIAARD